MSKQTDKKSALEILKAASVTSSDCLSKTDIPAMGVAKLPLF